MNNGTEKREFTTGYVVPRIGKRYRNSTRRQGTVEDNLFFVTKGDKRMNIKYNFPAHGDGTGSLQWSTPNDTNTTARTNESSQANCHSD